MVIRKLGASIKILSWDLNYIFPNFFVLYPL